MLGRIIETLPILLAAKFVLSEGKPDAPLPVHGIRNQSVDLTLPVNRTDSIEGIYWNFQTSHLAHITNDKLVILKKDFANRLETRDDGATLRINNLRQEDAAKYSVSIQFTDKETYETSYNLTVYEPIPAPAIRTVWKEDTTERCNVTLHCSVPSITSDFSCTWKYRHQDSEYQRIDNNGSTIQISLPPDHQDTEVMCIVQNPADQKNISSYVPQVCLDLVTLHQGEGRHYYIVFLPVLAILGLVLGCFLLKRNNKRRKVEEERRKESKEMLEIHYADLAPRSYVNQRVEHKNEDSGAVIYSAVVYPRT